MGKLLTPQPSLFHAPVQKDIVYTPGWLAERCVAHFHPAGKVLDPCRGDGAFHRLMPGSDWCEIAEGKDFFEWHAPVDWVIGNPPYSCLLAWIRHSFKIADNVAYLMPLHRVFASFDFLQDIRRYGGIREVMLIGTGSTAGFPFGHALGCVHYQRGFSGPTTWSGTEPATQHTED